MEINSYKDTKPTWDILPFDEVIDQIPRRGKDGLKHNPRNAYEIIDEGRGLDHCVGRAGYIESMAANMCTILFLRDNENLSAPLITIEEKQGSIKQCYGYRDSINHNIQIRDFIIEYAKRRELSIDAEIYSSKST